MIPGLSSFRRNCQETMFPARPWPKICQVMVNRKTGKSNNQNASLLLQFYYSLCLFADLLNSAGYNTTTTHSDTTTVRVYSMAKMFIL